MRTHALGWRLAVFAVVSLINGLVAAEAAAAPGGRVVRETIAAPSLIGNQLGDPAEREIAVYLPPSYAVETERRFPVVYFLGGFNAPVDAYLPGGIYGSLVTGAVERAMVEGEVAEMIVVVVSGCNALRGSFYVDSPVSGDWERHVVQEVVGHVDARYRTEASPSARGLSGHSMGGFGALNLALRHPEVFGWCYALSPSLLEPDGLAELMPFENGARVAAFLAGTERWREWPLAEAQRLAGAWRADAVKTGDRVTVFTHAYGAAFAPSEEPTALGFDYPFSQEPDGLHLDAGCWWRWEAGLGELGAKVARYQGGAVKLRGLVFEYGRREENGWVVRGCEALSAALTAAGVAHTRTVFDGGHSDQLEERLARHALPYFAARFAER
jgi:enterochelin esterase-like enzyme